MRITSLVENTSNCGLGIEHGLSLYIETTANIFESDDLCPNAYETECKTHECYAGECKADECKADKCYTDEYKADECKVDKCYTDECKADECKVDKCYTDECKADECKADECKADEYKADKCKTHITDQMVKILFDMGQGGLFAENARTLGISIEEVNLAVISHGHYDHGGGLATFLQLNSKAPVYIHTLAFEPHYSLKPSGFNYIGLTPELKQNPRLIHCKHITHIETPSKGYAIIKDCNSNNCISRDYTSADNHNSQLVLFSEVTGNCCNPPGNKLLFSQPFPHTEPQTPTQNSLINDASAHEQNSIMNNTSVHKQNAMINDTSVHEQNTMINDKNPLIKDSFVHEQNALINDAFTHEQNLLIREGNNLVLFAGCAHAGIINIMRKAEQIVGTAPTHVFAGMHLAKSKIQTTAITHIESATNESAATDVFINALAKELQSYTNTKYYTMHCTGTEQYQMLRQIMGNQISYLSAGQTITI